MNATLSNKNETCNYTFTVEHEDKTYDVLIYTDNKGKFIDTNIFFNGEDLDYEGDEGQIREDITTYLDENWDKLV
jgi:hypothetical protein